MTAALLGALTAVAPTAVASSAGQVTAAATISSASWGVTPSVTALSAPPACATAPASCGPLTVSAPGTSYFNVWNTGTEGLVGLTYQVSFNGGLNPTVSLAACSVAWSAGPPATCPGTQTAVLSSSSAGSYSVTAGVPAAVGSEVYIQATVVGAPLSMTISTSVGSGSPRQISPAVTTNA